MTQANYEPCLSFTLKYEGGRSNDPRDPGGRTFEGVTQRVYDAWRRDRGFPARDVYKMQPGERDAIYKAGYWDKVRGDFLRAGEDLVVWDFAVNSGPARARDVWLRCGGPKQDLDKIIDSVCAYRLSVMHALRTWSHFGRGWGRRVAACEALALRMASVPLEPVLKQAKAKSAASGQSGPAVAGGGGVATAISHAGAPSWIFWLMAATTVIAVLAFAFKSWRHAQRADALAQAVKDDMEAQAAAAVRFAEAPGRL